MGAEQGFLKEASLRHSRCGVVSNRQMLVHICPPPLLKLLVNHIQWLPTSSLVKK